MEAKFTPESHIVDYVKNHDRRDSLLYNNICFSIYIRPSDENKKQYECNRLYILNNFS